ncbi:MAG: hypothetical protein VKP62_16590 [Candidatus Sericytochromatia bacterium]|nr:hypothetical protein [Candidatus Sericytochromatia bacterium]
MGWRRIAGVVCLVWACAQQPAVSQVGMTVTEFEAISGKAIDRYRTEEGGEGRIYRDVWVSERSKKQFKGRTAIELGADRRVIKELFLFDDPLPNSDEGAIDAVGIAFNLMPTGTPRRFVASGKRPYENGWVLWFDYGEGRYLNFFLDQQESSIEAVVGGLEATPI